MVYCDGTIFTYFKYIEKIPWYYHHASVQKHDITIIKAHFVRASFSNISKSTAY